jgi:hypothetical protein
MPATCAGSAAQKSENRWPSGQSPAEWRSKPAAARRAGQTKARGQFSILFHSGGLLPAMRFQVLDKAVRSAPLSRCVHEMRGSCCSYKFERESPLAKQLFNLGCFGWHDGCPAWMQPVDSNDEVALRRPLRPRHSRHGHGHAGCTATRMRFGAGPGVPATGGAPDRAGMA